METTPSKLKLISAISVVTGCVIGSGVFVKPGRVLLAAGDSNRALLAWLIGGLISLAGGLTVAEIAARVTKNGGVYSFMEELYGKKVGFITGWVQVLIYGPGLLAALALYFGSLFCEFFGLGTNYQIPVALLSLFSLSSISILGTRYSAWIQNVSTFVKLLPIFAIGVLGLVSGQEPFLGMTVASTAPAAGMGAAVLATLWAYDGWIQVSNISGEIENPAKNLPRAIIIGLVTVIAVYMLINVALFHTVNVNEIAAINEKAAGVAAVKLFGSIGGTLLSLGILISIFGCLNGNILTMTIIPYAVALNEAFPFRKTFSALHPRTQTPVNSIVLKTSCAAIMILLMNPDRITDLAIFSMYIIFGACFFGVFKLRKKYGVPAQGSYRVPLYPLMPLIASGGCAFICYGMIRQNPMDAAVSVAITLTGYPMYWWLNRTGKSELLQEIRRQK